MNVATTPPSSRPRPPAGSARRRRWSGAPGPRAPGMRSRRIGAIAAGDRVAVAERAEERLLARRERLPGGRLAARGRVVRRVGTRSGHGPRAALYASSGNGASYAARTSAATRAAAGGTSRPMSSSSAFWTACGTATRSRACRSRRSAGRCWRRPPGRTGRGARRPGGARSARPSPGRQRDVAQVEVVEHQLPQPLDVAGVGVVGRCGGLSERPKPTRSGATHRMPGVGEHRDHVAVEERPRRLAVQQQPTGPSAGPGST